ncbi:hypothetical protein HK105_208814 [Polyrhizophydium stewartii]|uniref:Uncharacterized protein n=1 Tax=Polyrhizophydium stewartii TaxID=2732419 RepID=A0ABR4MWS0_9FUNG
MSAPLIPRTLINYPLSRSLVTWGVFAGVTALYLLEPTGLARRDIFVKLPIVGGFWQKRLDALERKD